MGKIVGRNESKLTDSLDNGWRSWLCYWEG